MKHLCISEKPSEMKRLNFVSWILIMTLIIGLIPGSLSASPIKEVKAAEAPGIVSGGTYVIKSAYNSNYVLMPENSAPGWTNTCIYDNTGSDSQKWVVTYNSDGSYTLKNAGTDYTLHYGGTGSGTHVDQNGNDGTNNYKWYLTANTSGSYSGSYYLAGVNKNGSGESVYATVTASAQSSGDPRGRQVYMETAGNASSEVQRQLWYFEQVDKVSSSEITDSEIDAVVNAYLNKYYKTDSSSGYQTLGGGFWIGAELCEMMLDGYETTGNYVYKDAFVNSYRHLLWYAGKNYGNTTDWSGNDFNDDVLWAVIASVRAYLMFGDSSYLDNAKNNFDMAYNRGLLADGTIRWSFENGRGTSSTSCTCGPAVVAACYLAKATGDVSYYEKAKSIHAAQRKSMYDANSGMVYDSPSNTDPTTYNAGTWIGSCVMLYEYYKDGEYLNDAIKSMDFLMKSNGRYCNNYGIIRHEDSTSGDASQFRAICMRYVRKFLVDLNREIDESKYLNWWQKNARVAYNNRNSFGIISSSWHKATPNSADFGSSGSSGAVSLLINLPTDKSTLVRDAYSTIQAADMDYCKGVISENRGESGAMNLGGVQNGHYTGYMNVNFGAVGASQVTFRASNGTSAGSVGYIEVHLGSENGKLIGTASVPYTGSWSSWTDVTCDIDRITGVQDIYLVYKSETSHVCNLEYFRFMQATEKNEGYLYIKAESSGKYLMCTDGKNNTAISAGSDNRDAWEAFLMVSNDDGSVSFKSRVSGKYICAVIDEEDTKGLYLDARSDSIGDWEKFYVYRYNESDTSQCAVVAYANGKYLQVNPAAAGLLVTPSGGSVGGAWETFHFETVTGEWIVPFSADLYMEDARDGFSRIEAETYNSSASDIKIDKQDGVDHNVANTKDGTWVCYYKVDFGTELAQYIKLYYSGNSVNAGGTLSVYLDSMEGMPVGELDLQPTGSSWGTYVELEEKLTTAVAGIHDIYFVFSSHEGRTYTANIDWFIFEKEKSLTTDAFSIIEAEKNDDKYESVKNETTTLDNKTVIGNIGETASGYWTKYGRVSFGETARSITMNHAGISGAAGTVQIYLNNMEGTPVGTISLSSTGGWKNYTETSNDLNIAIEAGIYDVYLVFVPDSGKAFVGNIDWFTFGTELVNPHPDLIVTDISWSPEKPKEGEQVVFTAVVKNQGDSATPDGVKLGVEFDVNGTKVAWSSTFTSSLGAGESVTLTANNGPSGVNYWMCGSDKTYTVKAIADDVDRIFELNEMNNEKEAVLYTAPAECTVTFTDGRKTVSTQIIKAGTCAKIPDVAEKDGYLFAGWFTSDVGVISDVSQVIGDVYNFSEVNEDIRVYAGWIEAGTGSGSKLYLRGVQYREKTNSRSAGIRFISQLDQSLLSAVEQLNRENSGIRVNTPDGKGIGYGTVLTEASGLGGNTMLVKDETAVYIKHGMVVCPAVHTYEITDESITYTAVVVGIPKSAYDTAIAARPYITYADANGIIHTYYYTEAEGPHMAGGAYYTSYNIVYNALHSLAS